MNRVSKKLNFFFFEEDKKLNVTNRSLSNLGQFKILNNTTLRTQLLVQEINLNRIMNANE